MVNMMTRQQNVDDHAGDDAADHDDNDALRALLSALQLHSFPHLAYPLGELLTSINITLIPAIIIYSYKTKGFGIFQNNP